MGTLLEDLEEYANEAYTKKDVVAGLKLLAELAGLATLFATVGALSTVTIPFLGPTWSRALILKLSHEALTQYEKLSAEERKKVRAAVSYATAAFGLSSLVEQSTSIVERVDEASFFSDLANQAEKVEKWGDKLGSQLEKLKGKE